MQAEDEYLVDLVKNLVKDYIKDETCINILAISMTDDPANSTAFDLVRKVKAEARTIGVLTKPDRVQQSESFQQWIDVLSGKKFKLGFGYHVIKNNPNIEVEHAAARQEEREFFQGSPWSTDLSQYAARFGTLQLQTALSHRLTAQIKTRSVFLATFTSGATDNHLSLPRIVDQVQSKSLRIDTELLKIPEEPTGNLPMQVSEKISEFYGKICQEFEGGYQNHSFQKDWNRLATEFRGILAESEPILVMSDLYPPSNADAGQSTTGRVNASRVYMTIEDDDEDMVESPSNKKRRQTTSAQATPRKKPALTPTPVTQRPSLYQIPAFEPFNTINNDRPFARRFNLVEVREILQDAHIGLPGQTDPRAIERIIHLSMQFWDQPLHKFMEQTGELCSNMIRSHLEKTFALWQKTRLYDRLHNICEEFITDRMKIQNKAAERALLLELHKPMTFNKDAIEVAYEKGRAKADQGRQYFRAKHYIEQHVKDSNQNLSLDEKIGKVIEAKRLGPDEYSKEVETIGVSLKCQ